MKHTDKMRVHSLQTAQYLLGHNSVKVVARGYIGSIAPPGRIEEVTFYCDTGQEPGIGTTVRVTVETDTEPTPCGSMIAGLNGSMMICDSPRHGDEVAHGMGTGMGRVQWWGEA